jgi:hypothetical protein
MAPDSYRYCPRIVVEIRAVDIAVELEPNVHMYLVPYVHVYQLVHMCRTNGMCVRTYVHVYVLKMLCHNFLIVNVYVQYLKNEPWYTCTTTMVWIHGDVFCADNAYRYTYVHVYAFPRF